MGCGILGLVVVSCVQSCTEGEARKFAGNWTNGIGIDVYTPLGSTSSPKAFSSPASS